MAGTRTPAQLLAAYPEHIRALTEETRQFVRRALPHVNESADATAPLLAYSYAPGYRGMVATIILSKAGVKLGIAEGARLPDPRSLLEGSGKLHRYVQLKTAADLRRPGISALLIGASRACRTRLTASPPCRQPK